jgi:hypothetical protein
MRALDRIEHRRIKLIAIVQNPDLIAGQEGHVCRSGDGRQELIGVDGKLMF